MLSADARLFDGLRQSLAVADDARAELAILVGGGMDLREICVDQCDLLLGI